MSMRMICAGLVLATLSVVGGCHHTQSGYGSACCPQPSCGQPSCGQPNAIATRSVAVVPAPAANYYAPPPAAAQPVPGFAP
jgi:hypothetical protein